MAKDEHDSKGQLFTHLYLERGHPLNDSVLARRRIGAFVNTELKEHHSKIFSCLLRETGLQVPWFGGRWDFVKYFSEIEIPLALNSVTILYRFLKDECAVWQQRQYTYPVANQWRDFVSRVFREENVGYFLDDEGGAHYLVDEEFERNRYTVLQCLESARYQGSRHAFEQAHSYLDSQPADTKAAVRSVFESIEIVARLMVETRNLNSWLVKNKLKPMAMRIYAADRVARDSIDKLFDGFSEWIDAVHLYRHGQQTTEPVAPPIEYAVYVISTGASFLRLLVDIDMKSSSLSDGVED